MKTECPHCKNTKGFVFGACTRCGFNHIKNKFDWVRVYVRDLPPEDDYLIEVHSRRTRS